MPKIGAHWQGKMRVGEPTVLEAFVGGVPPRDLTAEEWEAMTKDQKEQCTKSGLYKADSYSAPEVKPNA